MGRWDLELISLLPSSVKVFASAGAGFDWVDTQCLAEHGQSMSLLCTPLRIDRRMHGILRAYAVLAFVSRNLDLLCSCTLTSSRIPDFKPPFPHSTLKGKPQLTRILRTPTGIIYCNGAGASSEAVADMALYHIISVFRNMTWSHLAARSGSPQKFLHAHYCAPILSHNPRGHTLGIVGLGNIGLAIAKKVYAALGMKILYYDIARKPIAQEKEVHARFFHRLEDMLPLTDCLLLAAPYSGATLITSPLLNALRPGARFVNIGRGSLVDEDALADALESGHLGAVGLDVHADEPHVSERLRRSWKVTVTSHTGGGAYETNVGFERLSMENVEAVLEGWGAKTPVNGHFIKGEGKREEERARGIGRGKGTTSSGKHEARPIKAKL